MRLTFAAMLLGLMFGVNAGAYIAEIIRAGIESIDRGQMEAARSLGMSYGQAMRRIVVPQTYRRIRHSWQSCKWGIAFSPTASDSS